MERRIIEYDFNRNKILFPIESYFNSIIINPKEISYSTKLKIDKLTKLSVDGIKNNYEIKYMNFDIGLPYLYHGINFHKDYALRYFIFNKEDSVLAMYDGLIDSRLIKEENYVVDRKTLERIFKFDKRYMDGLYVIHTDSGVLNAQNKIDGDLLKEFKIPSDKEIIRDYNKRMDLKSKIGDLKDIKITGELLDERYVIVKGIKDRLYGTFFRIRMIEKDKFSVTLKILPIPNLKYKEIKEEHDKTLKYLLK